MSKKEEKKLLENVYANNKTDTKKRQDIKKVELNIFSVAHRKNVRREKEHIRLEKKPCRFLQSGWHTYGMRV